MKIYRYGRHSGAVSAQVIVRLRAKDPRKTKGQLLAGATVDVSGSETFAGARGTKLDLSLNESEIKKLLNEMTKKKAKVSGI